MHELIADSMASAPQDDDVASDEAQRVTHLQEQTSLSELSGAATSNQVDELADAQDQHDIDVIQLVQETETSTEPALAGSPPSAAEDATPASRKQAWIRTTDLHPPFPNIFDFIPVPISVVDPSSTARPATAATSRHDATRPLTAAERPATGTADPARIHADVTAADELAQRIAALPDKAHLEISETLQSEKTYIVPVDIPELGWHDIFDLGVALAYRTILLRRDISPRFLVLDEEQSADATAFRPITATSCVVLAAAGLVCNRSTEAFILRQQPPIPAKRPKRPKKKKRKKRSSSTGSGRKYIVRPVLPSPIKRKQQLQHEAAPSINTSTTASIPSAARSPTVSKLKLPRLRRDAVRPTNDPRKIGDTGAIAVFRALRINTSLRSLALEDTGIDDLAMGALAAMLRVNCTLTELSLRSNAITALGSHILSEALEDIPDSTLLRLDLSYNRITDDGMIPLCRALEENETLVWLDLSWNRVSSEAVLRLLASLRDNFALRDVAIHGKDIDEDQYCLNIESKYAKDIAAALRQVNASFAGIRLSSATANLPVDKMKQSRWLQLPARNLVELDALVIAGLVPLNDKLLTLDLSGNPGIERWGILELLKSVKLCPTLVHLNLADTGLYEEVGELVGDLIATNSTLQTIVMHDAELQVQQLRGKTPIEVLSFDVPTTCHFDRWILTKCLQLNRATQELNGLRLPQAVAVVTGRPKKVSVNYSGRKFDVYEVVFLAKKVFHHLHIGRVSMNGCGINSIGGVALADGVRNHASLEILELENNGLAIPGGRAMAECIEFNASLTYLNLSWNRIGDEGAVGLERALASNKVLQRLDLRGNELSAAGIKAISAGVKGNACLQELYLRWNTICPVGAEALALALTSNKTLRVLDIEHHTMGARGALAFAAMLQKNNRLQELNMKGDDSISDGDAHGIGSEAAHALAVVLTEKNRTLTSVNVAQNQIGRDGIVWFANLVKFNSTLRVLDLSISSMDGKIADRFFECLSMNKTLVKLNLAHNRISNEGMSACIRALAVNKVLQDLNVAHNAITEEPLALLATKLRNQPGWSLKWLCLTGNTMTEGTRRALRTLAPKVTIEVDEEHHQVPQSAK